MELQQISEAERPVNEEVSLETIPGNFEANSAPFPQSSGLVEKMVEKRKNAIGLSGVSSAKRRKVKLLALDGAAPTKANVANGSYPFFRPLFLMTKGEPKGEVKSFMDWIVSAEGQQVVSEQGTVNLREGESLVAQFKHWENTDIIRNYKK